MKRLFFWNVFLLFFCWSPLLQGSDFDAERQKMLKEVQIDANETASCIGSSAFGPAVMAAMGKVERHPFVPADLVDQAYLNRPLPIPVHRSPYKDLIQVALLDSFGTASAGVYGLSESYLYPLEALQTYLIHGNSLHTEVRAVPVSPPLCRVRSTVLFPRVQRCRQPPGREPPSPEEGYLGNYGPSLSQQHCPPGRHENAFEPSCCCCQNIQKETSYEKDPDHFFILYFFSAHLFILCTCRWSDPASLSPDRGRKASDAGVEGAEDRANLQ